MQVIQYLNRCGVVVSNRHIASDEGLPLCGKFAQVSPSDWLIVFEDADCGKCKVLVENPTTQQEAAQ